MQLSVPSRKTPQNDAFDSRAGSVKTWIDALPMTNVGETTRQLFSALNNLNHQDIPAQQRFKALEQLCKPVCFVVENMKRHFVGQPFPLNLKSLKIGHLSREISLSLATGYKVLVMDQVTDTRRPNRKLLVKSIHRAIKWLSAALLRAYQTYEPCPTSVWHELHSLYRYAEENQLLETTVADDTPNGRRTTTIGNAYKQILLLALSCPYRLRHGEAEQIYGLLESWAADSQVHKLDDCPAALFVVNLDQDQPPTYRILHDSGENRTSCRILNTAGLSEQVRSALVRSEGGNRQADAPAPSTLQHLLLAWGVMPKRRFSRLRDHSQVIVTMGLSSIHYFVSGEVAFNTLSVSEDCHTELHTSHTDAQLTDAANFQSQLKKQGLAEKWSKGIQLQGQVAPTPTEQAVARAAAGIQLDMSHRSQNWKMVNISAGGYCLLWDNLETTRAQVGELLGIREESDPDTFHWRLGVIRWMKSVNNRGLELGVQMLSPGAVAIAARPDKKGSHDEDFNRGLLLPEIASIRQQATLVLSSPPFRLGDTAIVNCHGTNVRVKLTRMVENTGSFAQFQYTSLGEVNVPSRQTKHNNGDPEYFDDIWEEL